MNRTNHTARGSVGQGHLFLLVLLIAALSGLAPQMLRAQTTITVTTTTDEYNTSGSGTGCALREAIETFNTGSDFGGCTRSGSGANTIVLTASQTYTLTLTGTGEDNNTTGDLDLKSDITFTGNGATIDGNDLDRVLNILNSADVILNQVTIQNGKTPTIGSNGAHGGGIYIISGTSLELNNSTVSGNRTGDGISGGIGGSGGGICNLGTLTLNNSTVSGNQTGNGGIVGNGGDGGGIFFSSTLTINNSTITDNTTGSKGQFGSSDGSGGGLYRFSGTATLYSSLVAGNNATTNPDLEGAFTSSGYNLIGDGTGSSGLTDGVNNDQVGTSASPIDPKLDALANYGGPTQTHRLQSGSPAVDKGDCSVTSPGTDQRGETRPFDDSGTPDAGDGCDVGAVEAALGELPVELIAFDALLDRRTVILRWGTASETNNAGFDVQHQAHYDNTDSAWNTLAFVEGHGTTELAQHYTFRVENLNPGRHVFRLKQIDFDGTFEHHAEVEVVVEMVERFVIEPVYPNPFNPQAQFRFAVQRSQPVRVALYDMLGRQRRVLYEGVASSGQMEEVRIEGSDLPSGLYVVRVVGSSFVQSQTVTLMK